MYLSELHVENFRLFGSGDKALILSLAQGLTAFVGENDSGKTATVDAIRLVLGTRDQEPFRVVEEDFHQPNEGERTTTIQIVCRFDDLSDEDAGAFAEYLTYEEKAGAACVALYVHWTAKEVSPGTSLRRAIDVELRSGPRGDGPPLDARARASLAATYLRPLRDAERSMAAGRRSRLSQVLYRTPEINTVGTAFDTENPAQDPRGLNILGIGDYADALLQDHDAVKKARERVNKHLKPLSFADAALEGHITVGASRARDDVRLRQLLGKLDLELRDSSTLSRPSNRGLGSNNLLFIACELLLLGEDGYGVSLLLIEEPEAHLHPQRQLLLLEFLQERASNKTEPPIQVIISTHSPYLALVIDVPNLVVFHGSKALSLKPSATCLAPADYGYLRRFLDATRANMFFARGVMIVEGDAEALLIPTLARLLGRSLSAHGVSIVNVGSTGLGRYARIYQRQAPEKGKYDIPVACVTDFDVMPTCAPQIFGLLNPSGERPARRQWRVRDEFDDASLLARREAIKARASGQSVETFVGDHWTLEYDLAVAGLSKEVCRAAHLAALDTPVGPGEEAWNTLCEEADAWFEKYVTVRGAEDERATLIYQKVCRGSKPSVALCLAALLEAEADAGRLDGATLRAKLPHYLIEAIAHVTGGAFPDFDA